MGPKAKDKASEKKKPKKMITMEAKHEIIEKYERGIRIIDLAKEYGRKYENTNLTLREFWKQHYNIVICVKLIDIAWQGVTKRTLNSAWRKLWPDVVLERDFEGFEPVEEEIVSIGRSMGLEVDEADVAELVDFINIYHINMFFIIMCVITRLFIYKLCILYVI